MIKCYIRIALVLFTKSKKFYIYKVNKGGECRYETSDLRDYFEIIKKRFWIIITLTLVCALASGLINFFVLKPVYEAKTYEDAVEKALQELKI